MREKIVFGPIFSRRLGSSLGINLLPEEGKLCNFDCIYCECGWNKDGKGDTHLPSASDLQTALELKLIQCSHDNVHIDSITFSGDGEPTINPYFPEIIDITLRLRDTYLPEAKVSVLSNATMLHKKAVVDALKKVDNPILKLDAASDECVAIINQPQGRFRVSEVVENMKQFGGNFVLQTMFLKSPVFDSSAPDQLQAWMDIVRLLHPREVMVYTIDRKTPAENLVRFTEQQMASLVKPLTDEGFKIQIKG